MSKRLQWLSVVSIMSFLGVALAAGAAGEPSLLVVPAKPSVQNFCVDVARMTPGVTLVSYEVGKKTNDPALTLRLWNGTDESWTKITLQELHSGGLFASKPQRAILVQTADKAVADVRAAMAAYGNIDTISNLDTMSLANGLNEIYRFSPSHWTFLADRYELKLKDLNAERRRWGKYGPPRGAAPIPKVEDNRSGRVAPVEVPTMQPIVTTEPVLVTPPPVKHTAPEDK